MAEERKHVEINWSKAIPVILLTTSSLWLLFSIAWFGADAQVDVRYHGLKDGLKMALLGWFPIYNFLFPLFGIVFNVFRIRIHKSEPLLSIVIGKHRGVGAPRDYERKAYLSFGEAIKQKPSLVGKPLRDVYDWIKDNGVKIEGADYELPTSFETWERYRRGGERIVNPNQKAE